MWKDSIRNIVVIFQPNILRIVGFYVRHSATNTFKIILFFFILAFPFSTLFSVTIQILVKSGFSFRK